MKPAPAYKDTLIAAQPQDILLVHSPVGMPGRALRTPLTETLALGESVPHKKERRLPCALPAGKRPLLRVQALIAAVQGDVQNGLFFCGANAWRLNGMYSVAEVLSSIMTEWRDAT